VRIFGTRAAIAALSFLFTADALQAQTRPRVYKPGDMVEIAETQKVQILQCRGTGENEECECQFYNDGAKSNIIWMGARMIRSGEERMKEVRRRQSPQPTPAPQQQSASSPAPQARPQPQPQSGPVAGQDGKWKVGDRLEVNDRAFWYPSQIVAAEGGKYKVHFDGYPSSDDKWVDASRMRAVGGLKVQAACTYQAPGPAVTGQSSFSEALAKRNIYDAYNWKANGTLSAPQKVGVTFLSFQMGSPYKNTVANVPGYGAQRKHAGAPAGATIYTFKSKHMVCEQYRDGEKRRLVEGTHACFVDKDGSWTCPSENDTKITQLDQ
jgi:hypothetical protein